MPERSVVSSARVLALCTLFSRVTGFARDVLVNAHFGLTALGDTFWFAFTIPNLLRRLFAEGAIAAVFVPPFSKKLARGEQEAAWRLLARALALQTLSVSIVVALIELVLLGLWLAAPADPSLRHERRLVVTLTAIMQPYTLFVCVTALFASILNCVGSFAPAGIVSAILNVGMIAGLYLGKGLSGNAEVQAMVVAASVVASGLLQVAFLLPAMRANNVPIAREWNTADPDVRLMLASFVPVVAGQGALMFGTFLDNMICWMFRATAARGATGSILGWTFTYPLDEGALATLNIAQRLYQFPLGVAAISLAIAALPKLSRLVAAGDWSSWQRELNAALRLALFIGLLSGALLIGMGDSFLRLLFEHGKVGPEGTRRASVVIAAYGWGMWAFCAQQIVLRGFYSRDDVRTPLYLSLVLVPLNSLISFALIWLPGVREAAFGYASTITSGIGVVAGLLLLQRGLPARLMNSAVLTALLRMLVAAVAAGIVAFSLKAPILRVAREHGLNELAARGLETGVPILAGCVVYLGCGALLRLREPAMVLARRSAKQVE